MHIKSDKVYKSGEHGDNKSRFRGRKSLDIGVRHLVLAADTVHSGLVGEKGHFPPGGGQIAKLIVPSAKLCSISHAHTRHRFVCRLPQIRGRWQLELVRKIRSCVYCARRLYTGTGDAWGRSAISRQSNVKFVKLDSKAGRRDGVRPRL